LSCNRFNEYMKTLEEDPKKRHALKDVVDILNHCVGCKECNDAYDDWYYSPSNPNFEKYMNWGDSRFRKKVEARKNGKHE